MSKRLILGASLVSLLAIFMFIAGCGDGGSDTASQTESAAPAEKAAPAETATEAATETATETVAMHDCAGGCGMKAVPEDKMTEIEGKFYCSGCAKKMESGGEAHGDG